MSDEYLWRPFSGDILSLVESVWGAGHVWALDYQHDVTSIGRQLRFLNAIDEYTREALATRAAWSWLVEQITALLDELITTFGRKPEHIKINKDQS